MIKTILKVADLFFYILLNPMISCYRMVATQYYEHRSLRQLLIHKPESVTDTTLKYIALDIALALVHLRQLHIVHNNLNSKSIFIKTMSKVSWTSRYQLRIILEQCQIYQLNKIFIEFCNPEIYIYLMPAECCNKKAVFL